MDCRALSCVVVQCGFKALYTAEVLHSLLSSSSVPLGLIDLRKEPQPIWGFTLLKVVAPFHVLLTQAWLSPHRILAFPPRALCHLWIMAGSSGCSVVLLLISAAVAEAKLQPVERESAGDWPCPLSSPYVATELE